MATTNPSSHQPKVVHKLLVRTAVLALVLAALFIGFRYWQSLHGDYGRIETADTAGMIAAIEYLDHGQRVVVFKPDGSKVEDQGWVEGTRDENPTWEPDGNKLFFTSDREHHNYNLYRWDPTKDSAEPMPGGSRARHNPTFPTVGTPDANSEALLTTGGVIFAFDTDKKTAPQMLPPVSKEITQSSGADDEEGVEGQFGAAYSKFGSSFRIARWCKGKKFIAAIMERDNGEALVIQDMTPDGDHYKSPMLAAVGDHIDFTVNPKTGDVVYALQGFVWPDPQSIPPEFRQGNRITTPFRHMVADFDPTQQQKGIQIIGASKDDSQAFGSPAISPDGSRLLLVAGTYDPSGGGFTPKALITMPNQPAGLHSAANIAPGEVYEPSWDPTGNRIVLVHRDKQGKRSLYSMNKDGSDVKDISKSSGDYGNPTFSPQTPK